jgi:hypothetical protein
VPHTETPLFGVDFFAHLFERVFCPHPSLTALFPKCPMSAINSANNSSNTPGSLTWSLTSLLHTLIHPHRSSHSLLPASFYVMLSKFGVLPAVKLYSLQPRLALHPPLHPDSAICSQHIPHTPTCKYPFIGRYHLYNTVHYIKNHYVAMYKLPPGIHTRICQLS